MWFLISLIIYGSTLFSNQDKSVFNGEGRLILHFIYMFCRFEDGTVSFLDILALRHGFQALDRLAGKATLMVLTTRQPPS